MNIEDIQNICRQMNSVEEDIKWEHDLVFSIGGKMFCVVALNQSPSSASFKVSDEEFDEIAALPGFRPAPYLAKHNWVFIEDITKMNLADWKKNLQQSYELVKNKLSIKQRKQLGLS